MRDAGLFVRERCRASIESLRKGRTKSTRPAGNDLLASAHTMQHANGADGKYGHGENDNRAYLGVS